MILEIIVISLWSQNLARFPNGQKYPNYAGSCLQRVRLQRAPANREQIPSDKNN